MLEARPTDRIGGPPPKDRLWERLLGWGIFIGAVGVITYAVFDLKPAVDAARRAVASGLYGGQLDNEYADVYQRLGIQPLQVSIAVQPQVRDALQKLNRERCFRNAAFDLSGALSSEGFPREAAQALLGYISSCGDDLSARYRAADILFGLKDLIGAATQAQTLIASSPASAQFRYLYGQVLEEQGKYREAYAQYVSTVELAGDPKLVNSGVFLGMSRTLSAAGQTCEAMTPIQSWMLLDPSDRDTTQVRRLIEELAAKGDCTSEYAKGEARLVRTGSNVMLARVSINGVQGNFIVDTGASSVSISEAFANRVGLKADYERPAQVHTANGTAVAYSAVARSVRVGGAGARDVSVLVTPGLKGNIDGLLGMSFLSRFELVAGPREWILRARSASGHIRK